MKRITLIILAVAAILAGSVSCNKNEINPENPLTSSSFVIVPDYSDGTIDNIVPELLEDDTWKYPLSIDVQVTPAKYAEELVNSGNFNFKATFSPVETKSGIGDAFTISPNSVTYHEGTDAPYLTLDFDFDAAAGETLIFEPYAVSVSVEHNDGNQAASTAFIPLYDYTEFIPKEDPTPDEVLGGVNFDPDITYVELDSGTEEYVISDGEPDFSDDGKFPYENCIEGNHFSIKDPLYNGGMLSLSDWMSRIDDNARLKYMTIPGTHDSATGHILYRDRTVFHDAFALTQMLDVRDQLKHGVRYFDLRLKGEKLEAYHGSAYLATDLWSLLTEDIFPFLNEHNTEGLILVLKMEGGKLSDYSKGIDYYIANRVYEAKCSRERFGIDNDFGKIILNPDLGTLTMSQLRGKVAILFRDFFTYDTMKHQIFIGEYLYKDDNNNPWGSSSTKWFSRPKAYYCYGPLNILMYHDYTINQRYSIQDEYEFNSFEKKRTSIASMFENGVNYPEEFIINHTSGYISTCAYGQNAYYSNDYTAQYLKLHDTSARGIIVMDFAGMKQVKVWGRATYPIYGDELCVTCIEHNFYGDNKEKYTFPYHPIWEMGRIII